MSEAPPGAAPASAQTRVAALGDLVLDCRTTLPDIQLAYRTWGTLNERGDNAVLICHALTGSADADRWWPGLIGSGAALDPARDFIVCSNVLGGCYGSTGPLALRPGRGFRYGGDFPTVTIRDMVAAQARLLDALGVRELALAIGPSMGGMQVLEWAAMFPDRVRQIVPIGVSGRHSAWCMGISEAQRAAICADPAWLGGHYEPDRPPLAGLAVARMIAMCSYRSRDNFEQRFGRARREDGVPQVASDLHYQGHKLTTRFDAVSYVRLTGAMDSHDLARGRGDYRRVLAAIRQPALVVSVSSDVLYPPQEQAELAALLPDARLETLDSADGHDGFLIETAALSTLVRRFRDSADGATRSGPAPRAAPAVLGHT